MLRRHVARQLILQALFNLDYRGDFKKKIDQKILSNIYTWIFDILYKEEKIPKDDFSKNLFFCILKNIKNIDEILSKSTSKWGIEKTALIDKNILRMAICEILFFEEETAAKIVINEAIELSKKFGSKNSFKFVSGVLGNIYEVSGLKEKEDILYSKEQDKEYENAKEETKIGALVYAKKEEKIYVALIKNMFGFWTMPKGSHEDKQKNEEDFLKEKIFQKVGLKVEVGEKIGQNIYRDRDEKKKPVNKKAMYFLAKSPYQEMILEKENKGLKEARWFEKSEIKNLKIYPELEEVFEKAIKKIEEKND